MKRVVLDSSAFLAFAYKEPGFEKVLSAMYSPECICLMHAANVVEICYKIAKSSPDAVLGVHRDIVGGFITVDSVFDDTFQRKCAVLKVKYPMLSLADTIAISLAERLGCEIYTTDKEFSRVGNGVEVVQLR